METNEKKNILETEIREADVELTEEELEGVSGGFENYHPTEPPVNCAAGSHIQSWSNLTE